MRVLAVLKQSSSYCKIEKTYCCRMLNVVQTMGLTVLQPLLSVASKSYNIGNSSLFSTLCKSSSLATFLLPQPAFTTQVAGMKVKGMVRERCKGCRRYMKDERLFIYCMYYPKHNQKSLVKRHYNRWHLTHATQGKLRPY